jgi:hypothetical protein
LSVGTRYGQVSLSVGTCYGQPTDSLRTAYGRMSVGTRYGHPTDIVLTRARYRLTVCMCMCIEDTCTDPWFKKASEVDGGIWIHGRHNRGAAMKAQWEKENTEQIMGWLILKCEPADLCMRDTVEMVRKALTRKEQ